MAILVQELSEIAHSIYYQREITLVLDNKVVFSGVVYDPNIEEFYNYTVDKISYEDSETDFDYGIVIEIVNDF